MIPNNSIQAQGQGVISADQANTYAQSATNVASLRAFPGLGGMEVLMQGTVSPGDGGQGLFYWNPTATPTDDNGVTCVVPPQVAQGAWIRLPFGGGGGGGWPPPVQLLPIGQGAFATATGNVTGSAFTGFTLSAGGTGYPTAEYSSISGVAVTYVEGAGPGGVAATGVAWAWASVAGGVVTGIGTVTTLGVFAGGGTTTIGFANLAPNTAGFANYPLPGFYQFDSTVDRNKFLYINVTAGNAIAAAGGGFFAPDDSTSSFVVSDTITVSARTLGGEISTLSGFGGSESTMDAPGTSFWPPQSGFGPATPAFANYYSTTSVVDQFILTITKTGANYWQGWANAVLGD